jgi:hypothetical protein
MMRLNLKHLGLVICITGLFSTAAFAQKYEVHPLVGRNAPTRWADAYHLKSVSLVGVKASVFADDTTQVEGEFEYLPHFEFTGTDPNTRALVWGINASRNIFIPDSKVIPFFTFGVGGVTARVDSPGTSTTVLPDRTVKLDNNDTFAALSYGAGVKAHNVFGPVGLRFNILGRTMPNFFSRANSWAEITGGLVFAWGQK